MGDCNVNNEILFIINVFDFYDVVRDINIFVDGVLLFGSLFDIDDNVFVVVNVMVVGDGFIYVVMV